MANDIHYKFEFSSTLTGKHVFEITGCRNCMIENLAKLMAEDDRVKAFINAVGKRANELRQNPNSKPVNPTHN